MLLCVGMPYPQNLETAKEVEAIVRKNGAEPATVAILDGIPCVGVNFKLVSYFLLIFSLMSMYAGNVMSFSFEWKNGDLLKQFLVT